MMINYNIDYSEPRNNPVAILRNGAYLWDNESLSKVDTWQIAMRPRALAEEAARNAASKAEAEAEEYSVSAVAERTVVRSCITTGNVSGVAYMADVTEYSDGTFSAEVLDEYGNYLFPCSGDINNVSGIIAEAIEGFIAEAE